MKKEDEHITVSGNSFPYWGKVRKGALKIKVCGMCDPENISRVVAAMPDYLGFIFYPKSKRFIGFEPLPEVLSKVPDTIRKAGVFVDELPEKVIETGRNWDLKVIQLHGDESPEYCRQIQDSGFTVFKAVSVDEQFDFEELNKYSEVCDYFLFDTKSQLHGGTGQKFNWQQLEKYHGDVPFFLSGGIGPDDVESVLNLRHKKLFGIDINSGFEIRPAMKDVEKVREFITTIRNTTT